MGLKHSCGNRTCLKDLWSKEGAGAQRRGGVQQWTCSHVSALPYVLPPGPRRMWVLRSSCTADGPVPASALVSPAPLRKEACGAASSPTPCPHTEPIVSNWAHCHPFTGIGCPRRGLCQGHPPSLWPAWRWAAPSSPTPKGPGCVARLYNRGYKVRPWHSMQTSEISRISRQKILPRSPAQMKTASMCVSAEGVASTPYSAHGNLAQALGTGQNRPQGCFPNSTHHPGQRFLCVPLPPAGVRPWGGMSSPGSRFSVLSAWHGSSRSSPSAPNRFRGGHII